ncbi:hypothetical protein DL96DRAFT_810345 [Flagelloscypha sp. PMI_526]|nr:hypothetical protein DL96DRAFT_810345 [Flagelloscypha sp. PMI_526]
MMHRFMLLCAFLAFLSVPGIIDALPIGKREPEALLVRASHPSRTPDFSQLIPLSHSARSRIHKSSDLLIIKRSTKASKPGGSGGVSVPSVPQVGPKNKPTISNETKSGEVKAVDSKKDDDKKNDVDVTKDDGEKKNEEVKKSDDDKKDENNKEDMPKEKTKKKTLSKAEKLKLKQAEEAEKKKQADEEKKKAEEAKQQKQKGKDAKRLKTQQEKEAKEKEEKDRQLKEQKEKAEATKKAADEKRASAKAKVKVPQDVKATCGSNRVHKAENLVNAITDALLTLDARKKNPGNLDNKQQPKEFGGVDKVDGGGKLRDKFTKCDTSKQLREWPIFKSGKPFKLGSDPETDRVIFDEDGQYCGIVSHPPSTGRNDNSFVLCKGGN